MLKHGVLRLALPLEHVGRAQPLLGLLLLLRLLEVEVRGLHPGQVRGARRRSEARPLDAGRRVNRGPIITPSRS